MNNIFFCFVSLVKAFSIIYTISKGVIIIEIEIKKRNRIKESIHKIYSKLEDTAFSVIMHLPERFIPHWLLNWIDRYTTKRISQLKQQNIKQTWRKLSLDKAVNEISNRQQNSEQ